MAQIHRLHDLEFRGKDFHLIDSFEGLSELTPADAIGTRDTGNSEQQLIFGYEKAFFSTPLESLLDNLVAKLRCIPVPDHAAKTCLSHSVVVEVEPVGSLSRMSLLSLPRTVSSSTGPHGINWLLARNSAPTGR